MANHIRHQIRTAVVTLLGGLTTTQANVFDSRVKPLSAANDLPCLLIATEDDETEYLTAGTDRTMMWTFTLSVKIVAKAVANVEQTIDTISTEIQKKIMTDRNLGGLVLAFNRLSSSMEIDGEGDQAVAVRTVLFEIQAATNETTPDVALT